VPLAAGDSAVITVQVSNRTGSSFVPFDQVVLDADLDGDGDLEEAEAVAVAPASPAFAGVEEGPAPLALSAAPNPFDARVEIAWSLARAGAVRVEVFDLAGRRVRTLRREQSSAGAHRIAWDGRDDAGRPFTGIAFVRVVTPDGVRSVPLVRRSR